MPESATGHHVLLRSVRAETLLENFFVAAITSVLVIRLYLSLTGYPQLGTGHFHIAHVLWGGLLMLIAIIMLLTFLNNSVKDLAAVIGGMGFGAFIDEIGKLITSDNDYFFQPAVALIYIFFILLYLVIRIIGREQQLSCDDRIVNAFDVMKEISAHKMRPEDRQLALTLLRDCPEGIVRKNLEAILLNTPPDYTNGMSLALRFKSLVNRWYGYAVTRWWFNGTVIGFFAFVSITSLYSLIVAVQWSTGLALGISGAVLLVGVLLLEKQSRLRNLHLLVSVVIIVVSILVTWSLLVSLKVYPFSFLNWAHFVFTSVSGIITVVGLLIMTVSRLRAYHIFRLSILVSIFLTQVLAFYQSQFLALAGLIVNILILLALRYMINNEETRLTQH